MRLGDNQNNQNLGARKLNLGNNFNDPKISVEREGPTNGNHMQNPFGNSFMDMASDPSMQNMAGNFISNQVSQKAAGYSDYFSFDIVRPYFHIDNNYILKKLKLIFLPFLQKGDWKSTGAEDYMNSRQDFDNFQVKLENIDTFGVDMYLPLMSLITLTLMIAFSANNYMLNTFQGDDTEIVVDNNSDWVDKLQYSVSKGCVLWFIEALAIKIVFALASVKASFLDILCVCGYKFTSLVFCFMVFMLAGYWPYYLAVILTGAMMGIFVIKTLKRYTHFGSGDQFGTQVSLSKSTFLYIIGGIQIPLLIMIGYS